MPLTVLRASHPAPTIAVTLLSMFLALAFGVPAASAVMIVIAVFFNQIAIGLSNDIIDVGRDRRAERTDKPLVNGALSLRTAWMIVVASSVASLLLSVLVNSWVGLGQAVFLFSGFAYNAGLKATLWSALPYATGFAALPALVSAGTQPSSWPGGWVLVVGASLGVSAHFANVLPDAESDEAEGIRGLPQRLSTTAAAVTFVVLTTFSSILLIWQGGESSWWVTIPAGALATVVAIAAAWLIKRSPATIWPFRLSMLAAGLIVLGFLGAVNGQTL